MSTRKYIDFEVIKEQWNKYNLQDGSKLKTRVILNSVIVSEVDNKKQYQFDIYQGTVLLCNESLQGEPTTQKYTSKELSQNIEVPNGRYDTITYEMNEYLLDDSTRLQIHNNVSGISRTTLYKENGDRVYLVNTQINITTVLPGNNG